ncbi:hypothetical protein Cgig2_034020 [Carnegiea gigantea]|uniref:Glutaredoxin domain-containing protein n=1 Tax=Carnegiea gigantea TaxID=171969 RepID=A0A9Q1GT42_9CARY|nr:hypothetical protein Cgig2_034020 [Carnegiea gigantea]
MECERRFMWLTWPKSPASKSSAPGSPRYPPPSPPVSPIHKHSQSLSFKDVETLLNPPPPHLTHSLSSPSSSPLSLKDLHTLFYSPKPSIFHRVRAWAQTRTQTLPQPPDSQNRVVIYYTSLRVVRRTFEDCTAVRSILKGCRVKLDERDLSMDAAFLDELQGIIGEKVEMMSLPKVFVNGKYVGGAEEIQRLHESGDLKKMIQRLPAAEVGVCGVCGGYRFLVCRHCDGSHKVYDEKGGLKVCSRCNENVIVVYVIHMGNSPL